MSKRVRMWSVAVTTLAWVLWIVAYSASKMVPVGWGHMTAMAVSQMVAGIGTVICVILWLVAPVIETARVWHRIGVNEQRSQCSTCAHFTERGGHLATIIPLRSTARVAERTDN